MGIQFKFSKTKSKRMIVWLKMGLACIRVFFCFECSNKVGVSVESVLEMVEVRGWERLRPTFLRFRVFVSFLSGGF